MKTLALDIGNVCVAIHAENLPGKLGFSLPAEFYSLFTEEFEHGLITPAEFYRKSLEYFPRFVTEEEFWKAFDSTIGEPMPGMCRFVSGLAEKGWRAVYFSDTSIRHLQAVERMFPVFGHAAGGIYSYKTGVSKPHSDMFEAFEKEWGVPDLYLDDRSELIEGAKKRGWNALVFPGADKVILP